MKKSGVVAFAFGTPTTISSNKRIARIAVDKAKEFEFPIYTQRDVGIVSSLVECIEEKPGKPSSTLKIAQGAVQWAIKNGITEIWVAAARPHLYRAIRDLQCAARESSVNIEVRSCREVHAYPDYIWFCADSTQRRTQSRKRWEWREFFLRCLPFWIYKIIAR